MKHKLRLLFGLTALMLVLSPAFCSCNFLFINLTDSNDHIPLATLDSIPTFD